MPNPNTKPHVNHIDGNRLNNNVNNLEWVTPSENSIHMVKSGRSHFANQNKGIHPSAKLSVIDVAKIREMYSAGNITTYELAKKFGVGQTAIYNVISRKTWTHL